MRFKSRSTSEGEIIATETNVEMLACGCEWQMDVPELVARCAAQCSDHRRDRGRQALLPKPLPAGFAFVDWISANVRHQPHTRTSGV